METNCASGMMPGWLARPPIGKSKTAWFGCAGQSAPPRLAALKRSLVELLDYAAGSGIRLGLENRYHYLEFPSPDELEELLGLAAPDRLGFIYDVGHAQALSRLGFYPHDEWLKRFAARASSARISTM